MSIINSFYEKGIDAFLYHIETKNSNNYNGLHGGVMLLRYLTHIKKILIDNFELSIDEVYAYRKPVSAKSVDKILRKKLGKGRSIQIPKVHYDYIDMYAKLRYIDDKKYNTEDGQIRWLENNGYYVNLHQFWTTIPDEVKQRMTNWHNMNLSLFLAKYIYTELLNQKDILRERYNTEDGQIVWLQDKKLDIHLSHFRSVIPREVKNQLQYWQKINLSLETARDLREKLLRQSDLLKEIYNTEDGQIRWLQDNSIDIHLGQFRTIIPSNIKNKMTNWHTIHLPLQTANNLREKLLRQGDLLKEIYNTEDGQIRWLQDNGYHINLGHFRNTIPEEIKHKMTNWHRTNISAGQLANVDLAIKKQ